MAAAAEDDRCRAYTKGGKGPRCTRKAVKDGYCFQHTPDIITGSIPLSAPPMTQIETVATSAVVSGRPIPRTVRSVPPLASVPIKEPPLNKLNLSVEEMFPLMKEKYSQSDEDRSLMDATMKQERDMLAKMAGSCETHGIRNEISGGLRFRSSPSAVEKLLAGESYNPNVMEAMKCMVEKGIRIVDKKTSADLFREWTMQVLHNINSGAEGEVAVPRIRGYKTAPFLVKTYDDENEHEAFVGLLALNKLREKIPNFMYIYGLVKYPEKMFNMNEAEYTLINTKQNSPDYHYQFVENIVDSVTLREFIKQRECTPDVLYGLLYQIFNSLKLAYETFDYTHYDLHSANILVRKLDNEYQINYGNEYIKTRYLAVIIDYGFSHIKLDGINHGTSSVAWGLEWKKSYPLYDIRKLIMDLVIYSSDGSKILEELLAMLSYLSEELVKEINKQGKLLFNKRNIYDFPRLLIDINYDYILRVIKKEWKNYSTYVSSDLAFPIPSWDCSTRVCKRMDKIVKDVTMDNDTFLAAYDSYMSGNKIQLTPKQIEDALENIAKLKKYIEEYISTNIPYDDSQNINDEYLKISDNCYVFIKDYNSLYLFVTGLNKMSGKIVETMDDYSKFINSLITDINILKSKIGGLFDFNTSRWKTRSLKLSKLLKELNNLETIK